MSSVLRAKYGNQTHVRLYDPFKDPITGKNLDVGSLGKVVSSHKTGANLDKFKYIVDFKDYGKVHGIPETFLTDVLEESDPE